MSDVMIRTEEALLIITINRPEAKNAANRALAEGVAAAMDQLDESDTVAIVTYGSSAKTVLAPTTGYTSIQKTVRKALSSTVTK